MILLQEWTEGACHDWKRRMRLEASAAGKELKELVGIDDVRRIVVDTYPELCAERCKHLPKARERKGGTKDQLRPVCNGWA